MIGWLARGYFGFTALFHGAIALRVTVDPDGAAHAADLNLQTQLARSEFLTIYAGQLAALTVLFVVFAFAGKAQRLCLTLTSLFFATMIAYRLMPAAIHPDRYMVTTTTVIIEVAFLIAAVALLAIEARATSRTDI